MDQWQRDHITRNIDELVELTDLSSHVMTVLQCQGLLGSPGKSELESEGNTQGRYAQNLKFYMLIQTKGNGAYESLIKALDQAMQSAVVNILRSAQPGSVPGNAKNVDNEGMEPWQKEYIRQNLDNLLDCTSISAPLTARAMAKGLLNRKDIWALDAEQNQGTKILKFYEIVQTKGNNAFDQLIQVFDACSMTGVSSILKRATPSAH